MLDFLNAELLINRATVAYQESCWEFVVKGYTKCCPRDEGMAKPGSLTTWVEHDVPIYMQSDIKIMKLQVHSLSYVPILTYSNQSPIARTRPQNEVIGLWLK